MLRHSWKWLGALGLAALVLAVPMVAQTDTASTTGGGMFSGTDWPALITAVSSVVVILFTQLFKKLNAGFQKGPDWVKAAVAALLSAGAGFIETITGVAVTGDITTWSSTIWQGLIVWAMSMGLHAFGKKMAGSGAT